MSLKTLLNVSALRFDVTGGFDDMILQMPGAKNESTYARAFDAETFTERTNHGIDVWPNVAAMCLPYSFDKVANVENDACFQRLRSPYLPLPFDAYTHDV